MSFSHLKRSIFLAETPGGFFETHVDGPMFTDRCRAGIVMILWDEKGLLSFWSQVWRWLRYTNQRRLNSWRFFKASNFDRHKLALSSKIQVESDCFLMANFCKEANPLDSRFSMLATKNKNIALIDICNLSFIETELNVLSPLFARHAWLVQYIVTMVATSEWRRCFVLKKKKKKKYLYSLRFRDVSVVIFVKFCCY